MLLPLLTVIIKTIHRPWSCVRLIESLDRHQPGLRIHVLDDSRPSRRLSVCYPAHARRVNRLIETRFDIGISAGRNQLLESVETPYFLLIDDDHVVTARSNIAGLVDQLASYGGACDVLAALSDGHGKPRCFTLDDESCVLYAPERSHRRDGDTYFCDLVPNTFVAKTEAVRQLGWDSSLKVHEHWEFFYRGWLDGLRVAINTSHSFDHKHIHNANYNHLRNRSWYMQRGLRKHGLRRLVWSSPPATRLSASS